MTMLVASSFFGEGLQGFWRSPGKALARRPQLKPRHRDTPWKFKASTPSNSSRALHLFYREGQASRQYFDTIAEDAFFEFRYHFPGWPVTIRGRANLMASFSGYGKTIKLHSGDALVVHRSQDSRVVILEYEVHGKILSGGSLYDNRLISVITIENRKIVHWRDYMDSLAAWRALNSSS
jgi:ketosteroid isomerase-like protein